MLGFHAKGDPIMNRMLLTYAAMVLSAAVGLAGYTWIDWQDIKGDQWAGWGKQLAA